MCLFLEKRPSFGITGTVNCLLACDHANGVLQVKKKHREREREREHAEWIICSGFLACETGNG